MRSWIVDHYTATLVNSAYEHVKDFAYNAGHKPFNLKCLHLIMAPLAAYEIVLETLSFPLKAIEAAVLAIINLIGRLFCIKDYSMRDALHNLGFSLSCAVLTPVALLFSPLDFIYQLITLWTKHVHYYRYIEPYDLNNDFKIRPGRPNLCNRNATSYKNSLSATYGINIT